MLNKSINFLGLTIACLLLSIYLSACNSQDADQQQTRALSKIAVIGDSIGNGYNLATPWPTLIKEELDITMFNTSISGKETGWGLEVIDGILDSHQPSHLLISLGTNDATRGPSMSASISNIQKMVDIATAKGAVVMVGTVIPNLRSSTADKRALEINEGIFALNNATIVDVRSTMGDASELLVDGIHPNQAGQDRIANAFLEHLVVLPKRAGP